MASRKLILVGALCWAATCWSVTARGADTDRPSQSATAEELGRKIDELTSQLTKLDQIVEQLRRLRNEELPQLEKGIRGMAESSVLVQPKAHEVAKPEAPADPAAGNGAPALPKSLEEQLSALKERLLKLDEVAQQTTSILTEDLPRLKTALGPTGAARSVVRRPLLPVDSKEGRLVINNISGITRNVMINGTAYRFEPGAWHVTVPYGKVSTQLTGDFEHLWGDDFWRQSETGMEMRLELR